MKIDVESFVDELKQRDRELKIRLVRKRTGEVRLILRRPGFEEQTALIMDPTDEHVLIDVEAFENSGFARTSWTKEPVAWVYDPRKEGLQKP